MEVHAHNPTTKTTIGVMSSHNDRTKLKQTQTSCLSYSYDLDCQSIRQNKLMEEHYNAKNLRL